MGLIRHPSSTYLAALLACLTACQGAPTGFTAADLQVNRGISEQFAKFVRTKQWDMLSRLYAADAVLMPPNHPAVVGRAAIRAYFAAFPPVVEFVLTDEKVEGSGDLAFGRGRYTMTLGLPGAPKDEGYYMEVRRRGPDGEWMYVADMFHSSLPQPSTGQ